MTKWFIFSLSLLAATVIGCLAQQDSVTHSATGEGLRNIVIPHRTLTENGGAVD